MRDCGDSIAGISGWGQHRSYKIALTVYVFVTTIINILIEFDATKRDTTLTERGLDFARAAEVFAGPTVTREDTRAAYGETRFITAGALDGRLVILVWTPRGAARRIISMRKANEREIAALADALG